ncbi:MAG: acetoacetate--CoA ligase [Verrucomicrobia bacterium]|nr:acetoacetate--CoA ligase [Verrucomicrobiota bacterium]
MAPSSAQPPLWLPDRTHVAHLTRFMGWLARDQGTTFETYHQLYEWSVTHPDRFWSTLARYFQVRFGTPPASAFEAGHKAMGAVWFPGATLNYAEHLLRFAADENPVDLDQTAVLFRSESQGQPVRLSRRELREQVGTVAGRFRSLGVKAGDRVAGYLPNRPETLVAFLAAASLGAIWSVVPVELSSHGVLDRLTQIQPKLLVTAVAYRYDGRLHDQRQAIERIVAELPSLEAVLLIPLDPADEGGVTGDWNVPGTRTISWADARSSQGGLRFHRVPFAHPLWILFSSGSTGAPKPIVHGHGGMLLEHLKALHLHLDLSAGDRFFWYTTAGWMMWNFLIAGLALGATVVLYDGCPKFPDLSVLWRFVSEERIDYFGTSAPFLMACCKEGLRPGAQFDLAQLRGIGSTGAPLPPEGFEWVYREVKPDVWLGSMSGGTDVCTAFVLGNPLLPVYAGQLQCRGLGAPVEAWDEDGRPVLDQVGELVLTGPMPCMPLGFWNDPDDRRLREAYFDVYPGIWRHGDWIRINAEDGQCIIYGRSDSTLKRGGVRMGTSEFYRVIETLPEIGEALVIDTSRLDTAGATGQLLLFVALRPGALLDAALRQKIVAALRTELSPRHVPDAIYAVPEIPHTLNGKKMEVPVKRMFAGVPLERAANLYAVANPDALEFFARLAHTAATASHGGHGGTEPHGATADHGEKRDDHPPHTLS